MKPYNERLPLIDEAIESTGGVIERIKDYRKTDTHINYTSKLGFFSVDVQWAFCGDTVCTHDEYEQRARELGYKPKEQEMNNNNWYEKGELPPVGAVVDAMTENGTWVKSKVLDHRINDAGVNVAACMNNHTYKLFWSADFRPLRTETDKLIEQMERSFESTGCVFTNDHRALAEHLIEQGYRKIKPMSEDEFIDASELDHDTGLLLYRAGCRFLDQGE